MEQGISALKQYARQRLLKCLGMAVGVCLLVTVLNFLAGTIGGMLFPGAALFDTVLREVFSFAVTLVMSVLTAGLARIMLKISRGESARVIDLFFFFRNQPDRIILASIPLTLIAWITSFPSNLYVMSLPALTTTEEILTAEMNQLVLYGSGLILNIFLSVPLAPVYYVLADHPEMTALEALKTSVKLMKGHILKYLLLILSFAPWVLAGVVTLFVILLWVAPYIELTEAVFYRSLTGDLEQGTSSGSAGESFKTWSNDYQNNGSEEPEDAHEDVHEDTHEDASSAEPARETAFPIVD